MNEFWRAAQREQPLSNKRNGDYKPKTLTHPTTLTVKAARPVVLNIW